MRPDNEINPDVLGYIFEKYINQKQMGAYYTKEDITNYICKNTITPFLFDKLENLPLIKSGAFPMEDVETYIYDAVKTEEYLPTETGREYQARQKRYHDMKTDFAAGKISSVDDLITYNLDIIKFAQDWEYGIDDPQVLRAFYFECLTKVTILDPTVGSGAFLFSALNILEPLYEICLDKMEELGSLKYPDFAKELARVAQHPNREYFVLKSIIINNLFGVDIMEEAVEICKLRLFLKLVAQVEDVDRIEPLPDIDFNIRSGDTLVGYANMDEIRKAKATQLDLSGAMKDIEQKIKGIDRSLQFFRDLQVKDGITSSVITGAKTDVKEKLAKVQMELDKDLAAFYGARNIEHFVKTHQPFHWLAEFYSIMNNGGFDVIIGNPPYVEYSKVRSDYTIRAYNTESCGNLYAFITERSLTIMRQQGRFGMIVQLPIVCTDRMKPLQSTCLENSSLTWFATFDDRPARLFDGLEHIRACIFTLKKNNTRTNCETYATSYNRWYSENRENLFSLLSYTGCVEYLMMRWTPKFGQLIKRESRS